MCLFANIFVDYEQLRVCICVCVYACVCACVFRNINQGCILHTRSNRRSSVFHNNNSRRSNRLLAVNEIKAKQNKGKATIETMIMTKSTSTTTLIVHDDAGVGC